MPLRRTRNDIGLEPNDVVNLFSQSFDDGDAIGGLPMATVLPKYDTEEFAHRGDALR